MTAEIVEQPGVWRRILDRRADVGAVARSIGRSEDPDAPRSGIVLDEGIRRTIRASIDPAAALHAATQAPADLLGRPDLGRLAVGALADLVWWDEAWVPRRVWVGGLEVAVGR